jgi:hypothetical protein
MRLFIPITIIVIFSTAFLVMGCSDESTSDPSSIAGATAKLQAAQSAPTPDDGLVHIHLYVEDVHRDSAIGSGTPLYEKREHNPILAPDGHQVTLGEFDAATGRATVKCIHKGTHVVVHFSKLIPKGVYSVWVLTFKSPGFDPTFANLVGSGALGDPDGSKSTFKASASGEGQISAIVPGGPLSSMGTIGDCALTDEFEFHVVGIYHIDGKTYGGSPGPSGTYVEQIGFIFRQ